MHRREEESAAGAGETVARLVYASRARISALVYSEMERIRASALKHNAPVGVSTALLYQAGWFLQWKEGPLAPLQKVMERVALDTRHSNLRVVHRSRGPRLLDGPWSMGIVQCGQSVADMEQRVLRLAREAWEGRQASPPAAWRQLSHPLRLPEASGDTGRDTFRRVLVCSASGTASFDLVGALGRMHRAEVVHRRFAGARGADVATNYVDLACGAHPLRVVAMARHGLDVPLTRAFLPDCSHVLLLLSPDDARNLHLMERLLPPLAGLEAPPLLMGVASDPAMQRVPLAAARRLGWDYAPVAADSREPLAAWQAAQPLLARAAVLQ